MLVVLLSSTALADNMRCGNKLVRDGDTRAEVRKKCGEPSDVETRSIMRKPTFFRNGRYYSYGNEFVETPVEIWTYNFGPYKLMRRVRFVDGMVEEIETLDYGYHE